ncbi:LIM domain-containing protein [Hirsutella rhossiliensis]|uniref:LIM domain-containing protein n=1 Tax=Hirsutella rhossiliensis TaxID=111463 RepID=A0A9P8MX06_9HYPO|nr:LIM domain-containing protein [Hirsutella rhossiliensis]KAH0961949.1 LIM domain-containing protein [Hirsutella rhossiliensis]
MALSRESALTIKCSACGNQVEISMMGDHLCGGPAAEPSPPPDSKEQFDDDFSQPSYGMSGRTPPRVNTNIANRHFMDRGQLTPVSQPSESRTASPVAGRPGQSPTNAYFSRSSPQAQRPGGYGGLEDRAARRGPEESGSGKQGGGFFGRMNAVAPGPFNASSRPPSERSAFPTRKDSLEMWDGPSADDLARTIDRPGTGYSNLSGGSYTITIAPPKAPRKNGYGGFGPPSTSTNTSEPRSPGFPGRSETYPKPSAAMEPPRRQGSAPGSRAERSPLYGQFGDDRQRSIGPDRSRRPPPRTSLLGPHTPRDSASVDLAAEFGVGNPYHTPSDSASSGYSTFSEASHSTAQTSPARSQTYRDKDMDDLGDSMENLRTRDPAIQAPRRGPSPMTESPYGTSPQEMRYDPAVQPGRLDQPRGYDQLLPSTAYNASAQRGPDSRYPDRRNDLYQERSGPSAAGRRAPDLARTGSREPIRSPSRGDCKACRLPIKGKSISSADGRLTGKYHKACFVCMTCSEPFTSAEFYVLGDKPYCEQHYHKLNGSLCGACGRGIEGQYLEDEARIKYHVGCFRCLDCGRSLPDGYFEVDGNAYCERDAWKRTQQPPPVPSGGYAEQDSYESQRGGSGPRPGYGGAGGLPGRNPSRPGRGVPGGPRPKMNKRMTRLGRM